jgi:hypothetical protein
MMRKKSASSRTWKDQLVTFVVAFVCLGYGGIRLKAGAVPWRNHYNQPIDAQFVIVMGFIFLIIGILDVLVWAPQRRRNRKKSV